ncbi:MAG TPA: sigma-70 family RNA polymerase sigma factor [Solirubrobacteraceae bacterium]|nr:sigma-70 family RNA polymerase sigma factor [Solirubrobacteraceae bacterium]
MTYCLVPRDLAPKLHELLRRHFSDDPTVEVIVQRRSLDRRSGSDRRRPDTQESARQGPERRVIHSRDGRRAGERRATLLRVPAPPLPRRARPYGERLVFAERVEPSTRQLEDLDTARLVARIQAGDRDEIAVLYMRYFDRLYSYLRLIFNNPLEAEDATQQVFIKVLEGLADFKLGSSPFRAWLFVIARNHALNQLRTSRRITEVEYDVADVPASVPTGGDEWDPSALSWVTDHELHLFVERLPLAQRQVLFLRYVAGVSTAEAAQILSLTPDNVRKIHARGLGFLRDRLTAIGRAPKRSGHSGSRLLPRPARVVRIRRFCLVSSGPTG